MRTTRTPLTSAALALLLALVFSLGGCGDDLNVTEDDVVKRTKEEMALLAPVMDCQAGGIRADLANRAVIMENVVMRMRAMPDLEIRIAKVTSSGMDVPSYEGRPGERTEIASLVYQDVKAFLYGEEMAELAEYKIEDMSMAYRDLLQTMRDNPGLDSEQLALKAAPYMAGYTAKKVVASGLKINQYEISSTIESLAVEDLASGASGPLVISNFKIRERENEVFSLDKAGYASMALPKSYQDMAAAQDPDLLSNFMLALMQDPIRNLSPLEVKGFYLENLKVSNRPDDYSIDLAGIRGDFSIKDGALNLTSAMNGLSLAQALLQSERSLRALSQAAGGKDLLFDGVYNMTISVAADGARKTSIHSELSDKNQGSAGLDLVFTELKSPDYDYYSDMLLHSLELKAEDRGIVDVLLAFYASVEFGYRTTDYKTLRDELLASIGYLNEELPPRWQAELAKFVLLVRNGGKFRFAMNPAEPVPCDSIENAMRENPDSLGCVFEYSAPTSVKSR